MVIGGFGREAKSHHERDRLRKVAERELAAEIRVRDNADLPALDIKQTFAASSASFTVSLAVPLWHANRANTIEKQNGDDWRVKRLYRLEEAQIPDENTGENAQPMLLRRINARLILDGDDRTDMEVLPLLRISHAAGEDVGLPRQDPAFVPPCLLLSGSATLRELLRDLANQVEASRKELVLQITRGGFSIDTMRGVQFEQMLRLRTLNRYSARLPQLVAAPGVTPFALYLDLRELLAELAALHPDRDQFDVAPYDHDNPAVAFSELASKIRSMLRGAVAARFLHLPFTREQKSFVAALADEHLSGPNEYFLGIRTREDPRAVAQLVEDADRFKLMARSLAQQRIWGVKLAEERHPPLELPSQSGLHYFRLLRAESARMWERIRDEKAISIRWPEIEASDFAITLYMTVPE